MPNDNQTTSESPSCDADCSPSDIINGLLHTIDDHPCCRSSLYAAANLIAQLEQERDDAIGQLAMGEENMGHAYESLRKERDDAIAALSAIEERYIDGCDTYEDWKFMGDTARLFLEENAGGMARGLAAQEPESTNQLDG